MHLARYFFVVLASVCILPGSKASLWAFTQGASDIRTPLPAPTPHINGPGVYGARPGHKFIYRIPCTGVRPVKFSVSGLPEGLALDEASGIISGRAPNQAGEYKLTLRAANTAGKNSKEFKLIVGSRLGLTPQMGWNDWYTHYAHVSDADIRSAADAMVASGMADAGYQFISIDDSWERQKGSALEGETEPTRSQAGDILTNTRFPDMNGLTQYIHSRGLRAGIYSSPGPLTCARFEGSYGHEAADAVQISNWGFDLFKYDLCSYERLIDKHDVKQLQAPFRQMGRLLERLDRDIVLNISESGMGDVWKWGKEAGVSSWRTTGDLGLEPASNLPGFYSIGFANALLSEYAGPGGWNDPDYIMIGMVGDAHARHAPPKLTTLTHDEQYSYMSMWSLMAAPLFFSGDMAHLDPFTLNVLTNSEVIDLDQDSLGQQARIVRKSPQEFVLAKKMEDGSTALGLFNLSEETRTISVDWTELKMNGQMSVRDVWRQRDSGEVKGAYSASVSSHGVMLVRLSAVRPASSRTAH